MPRGTETITVVRKVKLDKLDDPSLAAPLRFEVTDCQVLPRQSKEDGKGWVTLDGWDIFALKEPEQEILSTDLVEVRGLTYSIEGTPARFDKRQTFKALKIVTDRVV